MTNGAAVLRGVVEEHLDEAEFLLGQWLAAARSARFSLVELQKTVERRLIAHLDALVVGGQEVAETLLWPAFDKDTGAPALRVAAAALALLLDPERGALDKLIELFRTAEGDPVRGGLQCAFEVCDRTDIDEPLRLALYATDVPVAQSALLRVLAARRVDPGPILASLLQRMDEGVLGAALSAAAAVADPRPHQHLVEPYLSHAVPAVRAAALRTALIWNLAAGWRACIAEARAGSPDAMLMLAMLGGPGERLVLTAALGSTKQRCSALFALGFTGRGDAVEACLTLIDDPDERVARLATEAVAAITDLPFREKPFALPPVNDDGGGGALPPLEEDLKVDLAPDAVDDIPLVDAEKVRAWWSDRRRSYESERRYIRGKVLSAASVQEAIAVGPLRRSGPLACEIAVRSGARVQIPALRLTYARPVLPPEAALHRQPGWR